MSSDAADQRLADISTNWTMICQAHVGSAEQIAEMRGRLLLLYESPVKRYLRTYLRDAEAANEVFQEFALRFCRGDFQRADRARGRFRDFLGTALKHLVVDFRRKSVGRARPLDSDVPEPAVDAPPDAEAERVFLENWREALLRRTWERLEKAPNGASWYAVLRLRAEHPTARSAELADRLGAALGRPVTPEATRQLLHRGREKFAELLLEEVSRSLEAPTREDLAQELSDLGLLEYCRDALDRS